MALQAPTVGEVALLQYITNTVAQTQLVLHLYNNDPTISASTVITNITEVPSGIGYVAITLAGTNWTTTTPGGLGTAVHSECTFSFTTAHSVYGYYITSTSSTKLLWMEKFSGAPFVLPAGGGTITISPRVSLQ